MNRSVIEVARGMRAVDGAGVRLVRVLGRDTVDSFDPFLMLDSFDSRNPDDYTKGFPMHPHRGIETLTYLAKGEIVHRDSLGNAGVVNDGGAQWMTAGSGIMHEEMPQPSERMLGIQLWINLAQDEKMASPHYFDIKADDLAQLQVGNSTVRVLAGAWGEAKGVQAPHLPVTFFDIEMPAGESLQVPSRSDHTAVVFLLEGDVSVDGKPYEEKSALLLGEGDEIALYAAEGPARVLYFQGPALHENIVWGGPIVMNTEAELNLAFSELRNGTFIKAQAEGKA